MGMNEETHSCPFTLPPHTLAAATLLAGCCHPGRLAQSTLGDLPLCQQWSITDHAQPAQSCRHSCGQLGGWPSPTGRAGSQPNCNTLPACPSVFCLFHLMLPVCLCVSVCLSNLVKVRASLSPVIEYSNFVCLSFKSSSNPSSQTKIFDAAPSNLRARFCRC